MRPVVADGGDGLAKVVCFLCSVYFTLSLVDKLGCSSCSMFEKGKESERYRKERARKPEKEKDCGQIRIESERG